MCVLNAKVEKKRNVRISKKGDKEVSVTIAPTTTAKNCRYTPERGRSGVDLGQGKAKAKKVMICHFDRHSWV